VVYARGVSATSEKPCGSCALPVQLPIQKIQPSKLKEENSARFGDHRILRLRQRARFSTEKSK
ncbi:hypothetical protein K8353_49385, partial [Burkholderia contaminans]|nr:hypothetical protein [Burkholderia contaminans]